MKELKLLNSDLVAIVDDEDYERLANYRWYVCHRPTRNSYYVIRNHDTGTMLLHKDVLQDIPDGRIVDHKDRNGLNCQKSNLRFATNSQNSANAVKHLFRDGKPTYSKYKGVTWSKKDKRWLTRIAKKHVGTFTSEVAAALAYNVAAIDKYGEFALLNVIKND